MLQIYTVQMSNVPKDAKRINSVWYGDIHSRAVFLDTTVKSGDPAFAPTWDMVMGHKRGTVSDAQYTAKYEEMMRSSFRKYKEYWHDTLAKCREEQRPLVLICYCAPGKFCHRHLLKDMLLKAAAHFSIKAEYAGEWTTAALRG